MTIQDREDGKNNDAQDAVEDDGKDKGDMKLFENELFDNVYESEQESNERNTGISETFDTPMVAEDGNDDHHVQDTITVDDEDDVFNFQPISGINNETESLNTKGIISSSRVTEDDSQLIMGRY